MNQCSRIQELPTNAAIVLSPPADWMPKIFAVLVQADKWDLEIVTAQIIAFNTRR